MVGTIRLTIQGDQRNVLKSFPGEDTFIVDNSTIRPKMWFEGLILLVSFSNLGYGPDCKLGRETVLSPYIVIRSLLDLTLACAMHLENNFSYGIAGLVESVHRIQKKLVRLFRRIKFDHQGLKHRIEYIIADSYNLRTSLLPGLKTGVSGAEVLI